MQLMPKQTHGKRSPGAFRRLELLRRLFASRERSLKVQRLEQEMRLLIDAMSGAKLLGARVLLAREMVACVDRVRSDLGESDVLSQRLLPQRRALQQALETMVSSEADP